ncbi:MAG: hypothetical protein QG574_3498 [Cyanobacteriota bacterium erpe_2018_sw_21hr_WHONDRS-SW48-000092_B_bin.40]|nr:hypothetical protein [Cyanobacteriota bacterium erpe_2018_sw_21hr_WHONDRS-SW48-000092_B_bin.40]
MFNHKGDLEQKPAKKDDHEAKSPESHGFDLGRTFKQASDALGRVQNDMIERVTNTHVKQQYVASISPALANLYVRGRDIMLSRSQSGKSLADLSDLSAAERHAAQTYQRIHSDLPSKIPFYNKETLANDLDRDIVRKARSQPASFTERPSSGMPLAQSRPERKVEASPKQDSKQDSKKDSKKDSQPELKQELRPQLRQEIRSTLRPDTNSEPKSGPNLGTNLGPKSGSKSEPTLGSRSGAKNESNGDLKAEPKGEAKVLAVASEKGATSKLSPINDQQTGHKQADNKQLEPKYSTQGSFSKAEKELLAGSESRNNAVAAKSGETTKPGTAGNALLTALGKNRSECESSQSTQRSEIFREPKQQKDEQVPREPRDPREQREPRDPRGLYPKVASADSKPERQLESSISRREKVEASNEQRLEPKRSSPQQSSAATSTRVRLIPLSQSNLVLAHRDGAINVARQLSDRVACSTIRVVVNPVGHAIQAERKPDGPDSGKKSQPQHSGDRPEARIENRSARFDQKIDHKPEPNLGLKPESKPEKKTSSFDSSPKTRAPGPGERNNAQEPLLDSQGKVLRGYRLKCQEADLKYLTGPEIALSAIIALASIAKLRTDQSMWQTDSVALVQPFAASNYEAGVAFDTGFSSASTRVAAGADFVESSLKVQDRTQDNKNSVSETSKSVFIRPKILIGANDSLVSIAEQLFNDAGIAWLILQLNEELKPVVLEGKTVVRLRSRQEIVIPVYQDIVDFQKRRTKEMCGSYLITVVEQSQIDREIVDMAIAPMLGLNSKNIDPLQLAQFPQQQQIVADEDEEHLG